MRQLVRVVVFGFMALLSVSTIFTVRLDIIPETNKVAHTP